MSDNDNAEEWLATDDPTNGELPVTDFIGSSKDTSQTLEAEPDDGEDIAPEPGEDIAPEPVDGEPADDDEKLPEEEVTE